MTDWTQLEKDLEAVNSDEGDAPALYNIMKKAPDLAALALAGKRLADAVQHEREMVCQDFDMQLNTVQATDVALTAFRKAEERGDDR